MLSCLLSKPIPISKTFCLDEGEAAIIHFFETNSNQIERAFSTDFSRNKVFFGKNKLASPFELSHELGFFNEEIDYVHKMFCTQIVMVPVVKMMLQTLCKNTNFLVGEMLAGDRSMYTIFNSETDDETVTVRKNLSLIDPFSLAEEKKFKTQIDLNIDSNVLQFQYQLI